MNADIRQLFVIGGGVIEKRSGCYFIKSAVAVYLHELANIFPHVYFVTHLSNTQMYQSEMDTTRITPILWSPSNYVGTLIRITRQLDKHSAVMFAVPQTLLFPLVPFVRLRTPYLITYVAGDWVSINDDLRKRGRGWRVPIDNAAAVLPIRWADHVLVRGGKNRDQARRYNQKVTMSLPIILRQELADRVDTCQREQITLLYIGKLLVGKGISVLLDAFAAAYQRDQRLRLWILGSGADEQVFRAQVERLELQNVVRFWGYVDAPEQLDEAFSQADMMVMPSVAPEGLPRVLQEGLNYRLPIIATRNGGIPTTYRDGDDMLMVTPGDVEALTGAIQRIIEDGEFRRHLIATSAQRPSTDNDMTAAHQHADLILKVAAEKAAR